MKRNFSLFCLLNFLAPVLLLAQNPKVDILEYEFHLKLNDENDVIKGNAIIDFQYNEDADVLELDFAAEENGKGMIIDSILQNGKQLKFQHSQEKLNINTSSEDEISIFYHGIPEDGLIISENKYGDRTFFGDNWPNRAHLWLPLIDHPSDKAKVSFYVTAPSKYQVVATGTLQEITNIDDENSLYVYATPLELPTKVMVIGVAEFAVQHLGEITEIPLSSWVYPENKEAGFYDYAQAEDILQFFTEKIAPFPFTKLANVQSTTRYGGMENAGNIFYLISSTNSSSLCSLKAQFPIRSFPNVLEESLLIFLPHNEPAPCAGYTKASSGKSLNLVCIVLYISLASSIRLAFIFPVFSRRSGRPTLPINKVSPVKSAVSSPSLATTVILSGLCPGVFKALKFTFPN